MAILSQSENNYITYLAWFGNCSNLECNEFDLDAHSDIIEICYEWTSSGFPRKWQSE